MININQRPLPMPNKQDKPLTQQAIFSKMTPAEKLHAAMRLYWSARSLKLAAMRSNHPDWTEQQVQRAVREIFLYARS